MGKIYGYTEDHAKSGRDIKLPAVETWPNAHKGYEIKIVLPEYTSICPKTGLPDFGTLTVEYMPARLCVELKSLKYYILGYRNVGIFYENAVNRILDDLAKATKPVWMTVTGEFTTRGGMRSTVTARWPRKTPQKPLTPGRRGGSGFTLMELMITLSIVMIISAIAVPRFANMIRKANEASTVGKLGAIRSALTIYYADTEGNFPGDLSPLMTPGSKYLTGVVPMYTYEHGGSNQITFYDTSDLPTDTAGWGYVNARGSANWGNVFVDCTHTDLKGSLWTTY